MIHHDLNCVSNCGINVVQNLDIYDFGQCNYQPISALFSYSPQDWLHLKSTQLISHHVFL